MFGGAALDAVGEALVAPVVDALAIGAGVVVLAFFVVGAFGFGAGFDFGGEEVAAAVEVGEDDAAGVVVLCEVDDGFGD